MPPKRTKQLKRAAAELDDALNNSPVRKKKSKPNLVQPQVAIPQNVPPPLEVVTSAPQFMDTYEPEAALHLTKATNLINFATDKINFYIDLLSLFNNEVDDQAITLANRTNEKIEKWDTYHTKVKKTMDVLKGIAPKKKAGASLNLQSAEAFLSSSGK
jgi:hypothetical protein